MAAFDELKAVGQETFCRKHDPYWDIPLKEDLQTSAIDLPPAAVPNGQAPAATARRAPRATSPTPMPLFNDFGPLFGQPQPAVGRRDRDDD